MVCLGFEPGVAGWKVQTNPLSYCSTPMLKFFKFSIEDLVKTPFLSSLEVVQLVLSFTSHLSALRTCLPKINTKQFQPISTSKFLFLLHLYLLSFVFLNKWAIPGLFFIYFRSFSNKHQYNFTTN